MEREKKAWRIGVWIRRVLSAVFLLLGLGFIGIALTVREYEGDLPSTEELTRHKPPQVTRVLAADGTVLGEVFVERRTLVRIDDVPKHMVSAVLAAEDAEFYQHQGLDYLGMLRALYVNLRSSEFRQGASTITQQLVKNILLSPERTYERKIREVLLARKIETELSKDQILELYLNTIYFGHGRYGVEEAARYYFGKGVAEVTVAEAAMLASIPKGPSIYSPRVRMDKAAKRREYVLDQMAQKRFVSTQEIAEAKATPIELAPVEPPQSVAPEVVTEAKRVLRERFGERANEGGFTIQSTIDVDRQAEARRALQETLDAYAERQKQKPPFSPNPKGPKPFEGTPERGSYRTYLGVVRKADDASGTLAMEIGTLAGVVELSREARYNPKGLKPSQFAKPGAVLSVRVEQWREEGEPAVLRLDLGPQGAIVAIDRETNEIVALVGGYEIVTAGLDRASFAKRQPGSAFKPFVYAYGFSTDRLTPASLLDTDPAVLPPAYRPKNYSPAHALEPMRLRPALAESVNVAAVSALQDLGPASVVEFAHKAGIDSELKADLSLALGAYEVTPRELAIAYQSLASGTYRAPSLIRSITTPEGETIQLSQGPERELMGPAETYLLTSVMQSVVESGTGKGAKALGRAVAGKTGTTNRARDAWFAGFTRDYTAVVWVGYDDSRNLGGGESGGKTALPAFVSFMKEAHKNKPPRDFQRPATGLVQATIDPVSGLVAHPDQEETLREWFVAGTEPTEVVDPNEDDEEEDDDSDDTSLYEELAEGGNESMDEDVGDDESPGAPTAPAATESAPVALSPEDDLPPF